MLRMMDRCKLPLVQWIEGLLLKFKFLDFSFDLANRMVPW